MAEAPNILKNQNRREPTRNLHILVMSGNGQTRRLNITVRFIWILTIISILVLGALGVSVNFLTSLLLDKMRLNDELLFTSRLGEVREYSWGINQSTDQAKSSLILEKLDMAVLEADSGKKPEDVKVPAAVDLGVVDKSIEDPAEVLPNSDLPLEVNNEEQAWAQFRSKLVLSQKPAALDVEDFKFEAGRVIFNLVRLGQGQGAKVRGRTVIVLAVEEANGAVVLKSTRAFNLADPLSGFEVGAGFNISVSKPVTGSIDLLPGQKVLSVEILAWDEDDRSLIMDKIIRLGAG